MVAAQLFNAEKKVLPPPTKRPVYRGFSRKVVAVVAPLLNSGKGKTEKNFLVQVRANKSLNVKPVKKITYLPRSLLPHIHI